MMSKVLAVIRISLGFFLALFLFPSLGFSQTISCGQTITASISAVGEKDTYSIQGVGQGDTVTIRMVALSGGIDPFLELFDGSNTLLASGGGLVTKKLTAAGPYKVRASDSGNDETGNYRLFLQRVNNPCTATSLSCGQNLAGAISAVGEIDTYLLQGMAIGDTITLRMAKTSGTLQPLLELYDGSGTRIATGAGSITKKLTTAGPYTILARDNPNTATGNYRLYLQRVNKPCTATALACGQNLAGAISTVGKIDTYLLQGMAIGDTITLRMMRTSGTFQPWLELYDGSGTQIAIQLGQITKKLTTAGPYTVLAQDEFNNRTGNYRLYLQRVNNPCNATPLTPGQVFSGAISFVAEIDTYQLQGVSQGSTITLCMDSLIIGPAMELYDGSGTRLAIGAGSISKQLATAGPYTVLASDSGNDQTGNYKLTLRSGAISCSSVDLRDSIVTVIAPNGGESIEVGSTFLIQWTATDSFGVTSQEIRLSTDGGASFPRVLATGLAGNVKSFNWSVPSGLTTTKGRIRVIARDAAGNSGRDDSDNNFLIIDPTQLKVTSYTYDKLHRLIKVEYADGTVITYTYDAAGNRMSEVVTRPPGS